MTSPPHIGPHEAGMKKKRAGWEEVETTTVRTSGPRPRRRTTAKKPKPPAPAADPGPSWVHRLFGDFDTPYDPGMEARRLPNGNLLIPVRAESDGVAGDWPGAWLKKRELASDREVDEPPR
jgi:hypothetical protein